MMTLRFKAAVVVIGGLLAWSTNLGAATAEETAPPVLTLSALIEEALQNNPELLAMKSRWEAALEEVPQARALEDPQGSVAVRRPASGSGDDGEIWYGIEQSFPFPGKRSLRGRISAREADAGKEEVQAKVRELTAAVKSAYDRLFLVHKAIDLHREHQALLEAFIQSAQKKYAVGQVSQQDVLKGQVELSRLHNSLLLLEQEKISVEARINALRSRLPESPLGRPEELSAGPFPLTLEDLRQRALETRPELLAASFRIERNRLARSLAGKNDLPDFIVEVQYGEVRRAPDEWMAVGKIDLPWVFKNKYDARRRQAAAEERQSGAEYAAIRNQTLFQLQDLFVGVKTDEERIQVYRTGVLPQAEQGLEAARIGYEAGKVDFLNLIDSERTLLDFQLEYYTAMTRFHQSVAELERVAGVELDR